MYLSYSLLLAFLLPFTSALKFELLAQPQGHVMPRCIRNYVGADTLVVVTARVSGQKGDGQRVNIDVRPNHHMKRLTFRRSGILREMNMVDQGMSLGKLGWRLRLTGNQRLKCALRIFYVKEWDPARFELLNWTLISAVRHMIMLPFRKLRFASVETLRLIVEIEADRGRVTKNRECG